MDDEFLAALSEAAFTAMFTGDVSAMMGVISDAMARGDLTPGQLTALQQQMGDLQGL